MGLYEGLNFLSQFVEELQALQAFSSQLATDPVPLITDL
jgi:hypothetical protein